MQYIPIQRKACWLVSSITRQYGRCYLSFLSMSLLASLFGRTNSRTSGNDVLRELHRLTRYQLRWHWCGRHGGRGKLVSTRTYLQILGTSTDYSSPSVLLFTDSYRWLSFLFIYLFIYLFFGSNFKIPPFLVIWMLSREPSILKVSVHFCMPLQSPTRLPVVSILPQLSCSCYFSGIKLLRGVRKCPSDCSLCTKSLDIFYIRSKNMFKIVIVHVCKQFLSFKCWTNGTKEHFV